VSEPAQRQSMYSDGTYLENHPTWHAEHAPWKAAKIDGILRRNAVAPKSIGEVGCGSGGILAALQEMRPESRFTGFEFSPQAFEICRTRARDGLEFRCEDILRTDFSCDVLLAIDVFEHVEDYMGFLRKLRGRAAFTVFHIPLELSAQTVLRESALRSTRAKSGHLHYFTKFTALATLTDCGYEIADWEYTARSLDLSGEGWKAALLHGPRRGLFALNKDLASALLGGFSLLVLAK